MVEEIEAQTDENHTKEKSLNLPLLLDEYFAELNDKGE